MDGELRVPVQERRWLGPVLFLLAFGIILPAVVVLAAVGGVTTLAGGEKTSAGVFDLMIAAIFALPAYFGARAAWRGLRPQPASELVIGPSGIVARGVRTPPVLPWDRITAVRIERYGLLRRQRLVVRGAAEVDPAYRAVAGIRAGQPFAVYAIPMSRVQVDRTRLAEAVRRYSGGRLVLG